MMVVWGASKSIENSLAKSAKRGVRAGERMNMMFLLRESWVKRD